MSDSFSIDQSTSGLLLDGFCNLSTFHKTLFIKNFVFKLTKIELSVLVNFVEQRQNDGIGDLISEEMVENAENHFLETIDADEEKNDVPIPFKRTKSLFGKKFKPYSCEFCTKTFKWNNDLVLHLQNDHVGESSFNDHVGESPFNEHAGKILFNDHTGKSSIRSDDCPKVFKRSMSLKMPKRHHTIKKSSLKTLPSKNALIKHQLIHNGEPEHIKNLKKNNSENKTHIHKCDACSKSFYEAGSLKLHKLTHNDENLKNHIDFHPEQFNCDYCEKTFSLSIYLKEHLDKRHEVSSDDMEEYHSIKIDNVGTKLPVSKSLARLSNVIGFS